MHQSVQASLCDELTLEHIVTIKDIPRAINQSCPPEHFTTEEKAKLEQDIRNLISDPEVAPWFDDTKWDTICTEQAILLTDDYKKRTNQEKRSDGQNFPKRKRRD